MIGFYAAVVVALTYGIFVYPDVEPSPRSMIEDFRGEFYIEGEIEFEAIACRPTARCDDVGWYMWFPDGSYRIGIAANTDGSVPLGVMTHELAHVLLHDYGYEHNNVHNDCFALALVEVIEWVLVRKDSVYRYDLDMMDKIMARTIAEHRLDTSQSWREVCDDGAAAKPRHRLRVDR